MLRKPSSIERPRKLLTRSVISASCDTGLLNMDSVAYLDTIEEELNKRVDTEVEGMRSGMVQLVKLAQVSPRIR